jgi:hypothetical protein
MTALPPTFPKVSNSCCQIAYIFFKRTQAAAADVYFVHWGFNFNTIHDLQGLRVLLVDDDHSRPLIEAQLRQPVLQYAGK